MPKMSPTTFESHVEKISDYWYQLGKVVQVEELANHYRAQSGLEFSKGNDRLAIFFRDEAARLDAIAAKGRAAQKAESPRERKSIDALEKQCVKNGGKQNAKV